MLGDRLDLRQAQYQNKGRVMVMAEYPKEKTTDVPEYAYLKDDPNTDWDERARGLGGTLHIPLTRVLFRSYFLVYFKNPYKVFGRRGKCTLPEWRSILESRHFSTRIRSRNSSYFGRVSRQDFHNQT